MPESISLLQQESTREGLPRPAPAEDGMDMNYAWQVIALCALGYLVGGVPVGWLLVHWKRFGLDVRRYGSGNIGTSNVYRHAGIDIAVFVGPLQFAQGFVPGLVTRLLGYPLWVAVLVGVIAVVGNAWPVYLRFNGGRGVAVATGAVAAVSLVGLIAMLVCYAYGAVRGRIALGVLAAFIVLPPVALLADRPDGAYEAAGFVAMLLIVVLRRLEGLPNDVRTYGHTWRLARDRLLFDQR
ncbi:MAG TPA: glycerol-3-phosphate acyltransferase, partial [Candidatus Dormibacteraeota bacterium]|nr:glycerol-3-phosphate acyltransferase [Candidatus Dormibacteraeota bacterium]